MNMYANRYRNAQPTPITMADRKRMRVASIPQRTWSLPLTRVLRIMAGAVAVAFVLSFFL